MLRNLAPVILGCFLSSLPTQVNAAIVIDFEELPIPEAGFYNGNTDAAFAAYRGNYQVVGTATFFGASETQQLWNSQGIEFNNNYVADFDFWRGWSWTDRVETLTPGPGNQYASIAGGGADGMGGAAPGQKYATAFDQDAYFNIAPDCQIDSLELTNTTWTALSMRDGDAFAKQFGGTTGNDPDLFQVTFTGYDAAGGITGGGNSIGSVDVALADFRFADNALDFILVDWTTVDLSSLSAARSIGLTYTSTDVGPFGINTPLYVAVDNVTFSAVPETSSGLLFASACIALLRRRRNSQSS